MALPPLAAFFAAPSRPWLPMAGRPRADTASDGSRVPCPARPRCEGVQTPLSGEEVVQHAPPYCVPAQAAPTLHVARIARQVRSEEHTSELQSLMRISYAVFCLKKKKQYTHN